MALPDELRPLLAAVEHAHRRVGQCAGSAWDPHILSDPELVLQALTALPRREGLFLEWGSGIGLVALLAAWCGFKSFGIEINPLLVDEARGLAAGHGLSASFAVGSFVPGWYDPDPDVLDGDLPYEANGADGYEQLGVALDEFDVVYAFAWPGDEPFILDLFHQGAREGALLIANLGSDGMITRRKRGKGRTG